MQILTINIHSQKFKIFLSFLNHILKDKNDQKNHSYGKILKINNNNFRPNRKKLQSINRLSFFYMYSGLIVVNCLLVYEIVSLFYKYKKHVPGWSILSVSFYPNKMSGFFFISTFWFWHYIGLLHQCILFWVFIYPSDTALPFQSHSYSLQKNVQEHFPDIKVANVSKKGNIASFNHFWEI